ncbi:uncharacterized protein LY79DRAFT_530646, partial [Colletotrichum navitas]
LFILIKDITINIYFIRTIKDTKIKVYIIIIVEVVKKLLAYLLLSILFYNNYSIVVNFNKK